MSKSNFRTCANKGFQMTFANGWTISVQFGVGNYCENRYGGINMTWAMEDELKNGSESPDCEIAIFTPDGEFYKLSDYDSVEGWLDTDDVALVIQWAASR